MSDANVVDKKPDEIKGEVKENDAVQNAPLQGSIVPEQLASQSAQQLLDQDDYVEPPKHAQAQ